MASEFVNSPMKPIAPVPPAYKGSPGTYNGEDCPPFNQYARTPTPNGPAEKVYDAAIGKVPNTIPSDPNVRIEGLPSKG